jgi:hypothetical protein
MISVYKNNLMKLKKNKVRQFVGKLGWIAKKTITPIANESLKKWKFFLEGIRLYSR